MKILSNLFFVMIILNIAGCEKSNIDPVEGNWRWVRTYNAWGSYTSTPKTAGFTRTFEITHGIIIEYRNDTLINTAAYTIEKLSSNALVFKSSVISSNYSIVRDTLIFNESYVDGPVIWFAGTKK
jgi:hypothetical protein